MTLHTIPDELRDAQQWVGWKYIERDGKRTKMPVSVRTGNAASSTDPATWADFESAVMHSENLDGIGYVFAPAGGMVGIDLDHSLDENGAAEPWARTIIDQFGTYCEISPSGRGVKLWVRGKMPGDGKGKRRPYGGGEVEMYGSGRFFTVTGDVFEAGNTIVANQDSIDWLWSKLIDPPPKPAVSKPPPPLIRKVVDGSLSDADIIRIMCGESNGVAAALFRGDTSAHASHSNADQSLCCKIAFYTRAPERIDAIFRQSGLYRAKWERADYRASTIDYALKSVSASFKQKPTAARPVIPAPPGTASKDLARLFEETIDGRRRNIQWPWLCLTNLARCLLPDSITVLCGGAGSTKSMLVSDACLDWMAQEVPFSVFHLEETRVFHLARALAQLSKNSNVTDDEWARENGEALMKAARMYAEDIDALGACIWDAPSDTVTPADIVDWARDRCAKDKSRIIVVDPITAANSGSEPWKADQEFINGMKKILRDHGASAVVVTHPRGGPQHGNRLDQIAGGRSYNRLSSAVLWLESRDADVAKIKTSFGNQTMPVNRVIQIWKARNGIGVGAEIGYWFDSTTLKFKEQGVIVKEKK